MPQGCVRAEEAAGGAGEMPSGPALGSPCSPEGFRACSRVQLPPAAARCFEGLSALFSFAALGKLLVSSSLLSARRFVRGVGHVKDTENRI